MATEFEQRKVVQLGLLLLPLTAFLTGCIGEGFTSIPNTHLSETSGANFISDHNQGINPNPTPTGNNNSVPGGNNSPAPTPTPGSGPGGGSASFQYSAPNNSVDLRAYFPSAYTENILRNHGGGLYAAYRFYQATPSLGGSFLDLYNLFFNLKKPGRLHIWEKRYAPNPQNCIATYAHLFMGDDLSVTEVGDWYARDGCSPDIAFGYLENLAKPSGLAWSGSGGLRTPQSSPGLDTPQSSLRNDLAITAQNMPGAAYTHTAGYFAWNETVVIETLAQFKPAYGRSGQGVWGAGMGKTYSNVIRVIFYHGTKTPSMRNINCASLLDSSWDYTRLYRTHSGYNSYASEYYLAPGRGIIQEAFLYTEDGSYWQFPDCHGLITGTNRQMAIQTWTNYIDD